MAKKAATLPREWRISVIGAKSQYLGRVMAPDEASAIAKAVEEFKIDPARRFRPVAQPVE